MAVIDTPPTLGTLLVNALTASDEVIIPMNADILSLQGLYQLAETIDQVKSFCNKGLKVTGILLTRYSGRTVLARDIKETIEAKCAEVIYIELDNLYKVNNTLRELENYIPEAFSYQIFAPKSNHIGNVGINLVIDKRIDLDVSSLTEIENVVFAIEE